MLLRLGFIIWAFLLALGQFSALSKGTYGGLYIFDLFGLIWVFVGSIFFLIKKGKKGFIIPRYYLLGFGFVFIAMVTLLKVLPKFSYIELGYASFYIFRFLLYLMGGVLVYNAVVQKIFSANFIYNLLSFTILLIAFLGILQLIFIPDFTDLDPSLGWDPHKNRLTATFFDPNFLGAFLVLCFNLLLGLQEKPFSKVLTGLVLVLILLTFSRSAWLMLAVSIFVWGVFKYRLLLFLSLILAFSAYFAVPRVQTRISGITDPADSAHFRIISWKNTWKIAQDNLFLGTGFNTFRFAQKDYGYFGVGEGGHSGGGSDSSFLLVLATTGIIGTLLYAAFWIFPLLWILTTSPKGVWDLVLFSSFGSLIAESFFINSLFYPQIMFLWNLIFALFLANRAYRLR